MKSVSLFRVILISILVISLFSCKNTYYPPPDSEGSWRTLRNAEEILHKTGIDKSKLDLAFDYIRKHTKNGGLLVLKDGWLVYEEYFGKGHRMANPNLASCGKSFTSIAVGILMNDYPELFADGLDQKVYTPVYLPPEAFPLSDPRKAEIRLGELLAFSAGIRGNNPSYVNGAERMIDPPGPDGWFAMVDSIALGKKDYIDNRGRQYSAEKLWCKPGEGYSYATSSIHIASIVLRHITGMELEEYIQLKLANPMGWGEWGYGYKNATRVTHTPGGAGIALHSTDMLRFCYLLLNEGRWKGKQIVPAEYVQHCRQKSTYNPHFPYSLQFNVNTDGNIPEFPEDTFWKRGSGGHCFYIVPSLNLVVWKLGGRDSQYSPENTGIQISQEEMKAREARDNWQATVNDEEATVKTLQMVLDAFNQN